MIADVLVAMIGTRRRIPAVLEDVAETIGHLHRDVIVVTGDAPGVDLHVKRICDRVGVRYIECHARKVGGAWVSRVSGPERNEIIARLAHRVIAWPASPRDTPEQRKLSAGSWDCVERFEKRGKRVDVRNVAWTTP